MAKPIDITTIQVIKSVLDKFRLESNIMSIIDNLNNTYTIEVDNLRLLESGFVITIKNTPNFNNEFVVKSTNISASTFIIELQSGLTITTFGTIKPITPVFYFEKWIGAQNEIYSNATDYVSAKKAFPCCLLLLDIEEKNNNGIGFEVSTFTIYFFQSTDVSKNSIWRDANTFVLLRKLYSFFINELTKSNYVINDFNHTKTERFYLVTADKNQNKIGIVDAIEIQINDLKIRNLINC